MKLKTKQRSMPSAEADMTPMIDMTFQLIAFFMVLIKFSEAETSQKVQLPLSELAKPPEKAPDHFVTIQVTAYKTGIIRGNEQAIDGGLETLIQREADIVRKKPGAGSPGAATVIIRAHKDCPTGAVQEIVAMAQKAQFEKFALRAEYDQRD
jgi:biopolymer transport protein ExbD